MSFEMEGAPSPRVSVPEGGQLAGWKGSRGPSRWNQGRHQTFFILSVLRLALPVSQPRWDGLRLGTGLWMVPGEPGARAAAERGTPAKRPPRPPCAQSGLSLVTYTEPLRRGGVGGRERHRSSQSVECGIWGGADPLPSPTAWTRDSSLGLRASSSPLGLALVPVKLVFPPLGLEEEHRGPS